MLRQIELTARHIALTILADENPQHKYYARALSLSALDLKNEVSQDCMSSIVDRVSNILIDEHLEHHRLIGKVIKS